MLRKYSGALFPFLAKIIESGVPSSRISAAKVVNTVSWESGPPKKIRRASRDNRGAGRNKAVKSKCLILITLFAASALQAHAQAEKKVWQSDVRIAQFELSQISPGSAVAVRLVVAAGDNEARSVKIEIMIPVGVTVLRNAEGCRMSPGPVSGLSARLSCDLGDVAGGASREVLVSISSRASTMASRLGAFAFSDTPDPLPQNNFAERAMP